MNEEDLKKDEVEKSAVQLLQEINAGLVDPKLLDPANRQRCVEVLVAEGYTIPNIAQVLKRSEKTINRDLKEIQDRHALSPNVEFVKRFVGQVYQKAMNHHDYLVRLARSQGATVGEKAQAEYAAWRVLRELIERLQTLGYMPMKPKEITGDIYLHGNDQPADIQTLRKEIESMELITQECGGMTEESRRRIDELKIELKKIEIEDELKKIKTTSIPEDKQNDQL